MSIAAALSTIAQHRDVVPAYFHRASSSWIVGGVSKTNAGAVVLTEDGAFRGAYPTKKAAIADLTNN